MAPSYCKSATRFDVLEEVRLMVSLAHAVNELALLGLHPSVSAEPGVPEVKSAPVAGNRKQFILVTSSHRWRHRGEFPNFQVFLESQRAIVVSECEWTKANTRVHTTSTYLHLPQDLIVSYSHSIILTNLGNTHHRSCSNKLFDRSYAATRPPPLSSTRRSMGSSVLSGESCCNNNLCITICE